MMKCGGFFWVFKLTWIFYKSFKIIHSMWVFVISALKSPSKSHSYVLKSLTLLIILKKKRYANLFHLLQELLSVLTLSNVTSVHHLRATTKLPWSIFLRRDAESVLRSKKKLKSFDPRGTDIDSTKVYLNECLCQNYTFFWNKRK